MTHLTISSSSGNTYYYYPGTNKISPEKKAIDNIDISTEYYLGAESVFDNIEMYVIEVTQQCNFRCSYCIYSGQFNGRRPHNDQTMTMETAQQVIKFICAQSRADSKIIVCFYGGEALLALHVVKAIVDGIRQQFGTNVEFAVSTNGYNLTDETIDWICSIPDMAVTVTIDGSPEMHDRRRRTITGMPTFERIYNRLLRFAQRYPHQFESRIQYICTVDSVKDKIRLIEYWQSNALFKAHKPRHISFITKPGIINVDIDDEMYEYYRRGMADYIEKRDSVYADDFRKLIDEIQQRQYYTLPQRQRLVTCAHQLYGCYINATGKVYLCEKMGDDKVIGNIETGIDNHLVEKFNQAYLDRKNRHCSSCWAQRLCKICASSLNHEDDYFALLCSREQRRLMMAMTLFVDYKEVTFRGSALPS